MWQERIQRYILPGSIEQDPDFAGNPAVEPHRIAGDRRRGDRRFRVHGQCPVLLDPNPEMLPTGPCCSSSVLGLGGLTFLSARVKALYPHAR